MSEKPDILTVPSDEELRQTAISLSYSGTSGLLLVHVDDLQMALRQVRDRTQEATERRLLGTAHGILGAMAEIKANQQNYCPCCAKPKMNCDCDYEGEKDSHAKRPDILTVAREALKHERNCMRHCQVCSQNARVLAQAVIDLSAARERERKQVISILDRVQPYLRHIPDVYHTEIEELRAALDGKDLGGLKGGA